MAKYSERDLAAAERIVRGLFNREVNTHDWEDGITIEDIEGDTDQFIDDLELLAEFGLDVPAIRIGEQGELIPIELRHLLEINGVIGIPRGRYLRSTPLRDFLYELRDEMYRAIERSESKIPRSEARATFERLATRFLANRIAGARELRRSTDHKQNRISFLNLFQRKGGGKIAVPGCTFSVSTNTSGLRVLWSGGYVLSPKFFAAPTSPVSSTLQSGTYVFGVDGGAYGGIPQWDITALVTLPGNPSIHLNF